MTNLQRGILVGLLIGSVFIGSMLMLHREYWWQQNVNERGWKAEQTYGYLTEPIKLSNGQTVTRAALLDALLVEITKTTDQGK